MCPRRPDDPSKHVTDTNRLGRRPASVIPITSGPCVGGMQADQYAASACITSSLGAASYGDPNSALGSLSFTGLLVAAEPARRLCTATPATRSATTAAATGTAITAGLVLGASCTTTTTTRGASCGADGDTVGGDFVAVGVFDAADGDGVARAGTLVTDAGVGAGVGDTVLGAVV